MSYRPFLTYFLSARSASINNKRLVSTTSLKALQPIASSQTRQFTRLPLSALLLMLLCLCGSAFGQSQSSSANASSNSQQTVAVPSNNQFTLRTSAQPAQATGSNGSDSDVTNDGEQNSEAVTVNIPTLEAIQNAISEQVAERTELSRQIEKATGDELEALNLEAEQASSEIRKLKDTLENLVTGGADSRIFVQDEKPVNTDWRQDMALIAQPILDSLKELTEKPRRLNELRSQVLIKQSERRIATEALKRIDSVIEAGPDESLGNALKSMRGTWQKRVDEAESAIEVANIQIGSLDGETSLTQSIFTSVSTFLQGRGLTLLLATGTAFIVWSLLRLLLKAYRRRMLQREKPHSRTRYRLFEYSIHVVSFVLTLIAVFVVFYERGDVLLLGLLILLIFGVALSIRNVLPRYLQEARLLLDIGPMREGERIVYQNLPWRVEAINMYTILRNPELQGVLRVPLSELHAYSSRPIKETTWFPTSKGDFVLLEGETLAEVIQQDPDTVDLKLGGGQLKSIQSASFYGMGLVNLTRGGSFGVAQIFGIDYDLQSISTTEVPKAFRHAIREALETTDAADDIRDIMVDLKEAGASSLDYIIFVTLDSASARLYPKIKRVIQIACIEVCTANGWNIPFPHMTMVNKAGTALAPPQAPTN